MRRLLTVLLLTALVTSAPLANAQEITVEGFEPMEGLDRAIARIWLAPTTMVSVEGGGMFNEEGTPIAEWRERPVATPEPQTGIGQFVVSVLLFDSDENAATAFQLADEDLQEDFRRNPRTPVMEGLPLDGIGDQAVGYIGEITPENITVTYAFATVQDGPFVYYVVSESAGIDAIGLMQATAEALVDAQMNRMAEQFDPEGGSGGGLWSKLDGVQPEMPEGSDIFDAVLYPVQEATPDASRPEAPRLDLESPESITGLESIERVTYTDSTGATPAPDGSGVFRIDAWVLEFDSAETADAAILPLGNTLIEPLGIFSSGNSAESTGRFGTAFYEGFIQDRSLPAGNGVVLIRQEGPVVAAVVVYAIDENPRPVAEDLLPALLDDGFPDEGEPVLQGLVPNEDPAATPAP
jgi:hypothetical protein